MRENTKIILWVVVVSFVITIFAVWGLDLRTGKTRSDPTVLGRVNGTPVTRAQYQSYYEALASQFRAASNEPLTYPQEEFVGNQAWDNLVYTILTDQQIDKLGITVNNDEIVSYLRNSPPTEIRQYFLDDKGNFDNEKYQAALSNPEIDWTNLESLARERIPRFKLQNYLAAQVFVSEDEVRLAHMSENIEMKIAYVEFPIDETDVKDYSPAQGEIEQYYNSHRDEFLEPTKARVDAVSFELKPSESDRQDAAFTAQRVQGQVLAGEDIGVLAKTYSEAPTSQVDGSTGFIKRGQRENAYFDALDAMKPGDVSQPISGENGYYVLKLVEKKLESGQPEYSAQEILIKTALSRQTTDSLYNIATEFRERAKETGLDAAASEKGYTMLTPEPFTEGAPVGTIGFVPALNRFAFANEVGTLSPLLRDEDHIYVARVLDRAPESVRQLNDVTESIRLRLVFEAKKQATLRDAKAFYTKAVNSTFDEAAKSYTKNVKETAPFKAVDNLEGFGPSSAVAEAALNTESGSVAPPIEWRRSFVVLHLVQKSPFNEADYQTKAAQLRDAIESRKIQAYTAYWFEMMKDQSVIDDYRAKVQ
jgi:parvulin-like peptidyl-prolyl isomerase